MPSSLQPDGWLRFILIGFSLLFAILPTIAVVGPFINFALGGQARFSGLMPFFLGLPRILPLTVLVAVLAAWAAHQWTRPPKPSPAGRTRIGRICLWLFRLGVILPALLIPLAFLDLIWHLRRHPEEHGTFLALYFALPALVDLWLFIAAPLAFAAWLTRPLPSAAA